MSGDQSTSTSPSTAEVDDDERENKGTMISKVDTKKFLLGASARVLFYPTLFYNVVRNKLQPDEFRWWDKVCEFVILGAVPFPKDVRKLKKELHVGAVITLNEPFETLVPPSVYKDEGMKHLIIPTRDYLYAPSFDDIDKAVEFIHDHASHCITTYVHCKAGRGRSTTIVLCYMVKYLKMTPDAALENIRTIRPRVALTSLQWKAVNEYYARFVSSSEEFELVQNADAEGHQAKPVSSEEFELVQNADAEGYQAKPVSSEEFELVQNADAEGYREKPEEEISTPAKPSQPTTLKRMSSFITSLPVAVCQCVSPLPKHKQH